MLLCFTYPNFPAHWRTNLPLQILYVSLGHTLSLPLGLLQMLLFYLCSDSPFCSVLPPCSLVQDGCFHLPILGKSLHSFPRWWNSFYIYLSPLCLSVSVSLFPLASRQLLILIPFTPLHILYAPNKPQASCCTHSGLTGPHVFPQCSSWLRDHFTVLWAFVGQNSTWISSQIPCDRSMEILSFSS